jgi:protein-S-isoprenylcysteine O-methyltransferase Ste14
MGVPVAAALIVPALDRRFGWSKVPSWLSIAGDVLIIVSMWMVFLVFKENSFGSATVEVTKDQKVISSGPYAVVRHPMYASAALYFIGMSLALGSYWGLIASVLVIVGFVWRLFDEEEFLTENLPGFPEYCAKVRWRLVPGVF